MSKFGDVIKDPEGLLVLIAQDGDDDGEPSWIGLVAKPNSDWGDGKVGDLGWTNPTEKYATVVDDE